MHLFATRIALPQVPYTIDSSFRCVLSSDMSRYTGAVADCIIEDDGKILISGDFIDYVALGSKPYYVIRLNPDGTIDSSFHYENPDSQVSTSQGSIARISKYNNMYYFCHYETLGITRFFLDGKRDTSFNFDYQPYQGGIGNQTAAIDIDTLGRVTLCGQFWKDINNIDRIIRLNPDGSIDSTFHKTTVYYYLYQMKRLSDGEFLVGGWVSDPQFSRHGLWKLKPNGEMDSSFNTGCVWGYGYDFIELPDHNLLISGQLKLPNIHDTIGFCRLKPNGELDTSFKYLDKYAAVGAFNRNYNKLLIAGSFNNWHPYFLFNYNHFTIMNLDGSIDTSLISNTFGPDSAQYFYPPGINFFKQTSDGHVFVGGFFKSFAGFTSYGIVKLHDITTGIPIQEKKEEILSLYPNPAVDKIELKFNTLKLGNIQIYDLYGNTMLTKIIIDNLDHITINISSFSNGMYLLTFTDLNKQLIASKKFIIIDK